MKNWNKEEIDLAIILLKENKTYHEISIILNRTTNSVRLKLQKLGYGFVNEKHVNKNCLNCGLEFEATKLNEKKFCSKNCSASFNNKLRGEKSKCLCCTTTIDSWRKYCSIDCSNKHRRFTIFQRIKNGETCFSEKQFKRYLINEFGEKCMECEWAKIHTLTGRVPIQLEHIDGNSENNSLDNLKLLCPNCHSLTPTFGALNKGNGREKRRINRLKHKSFL